MTSIDWLLIEGFAVGKYSFGVNNVWAIKRFVEPEVWVEIAATKMEVGLVQFSLDLLDPTDMGPEEMTSVIDRINDCCSRYGVTCQSTFTGLIAYARNLMLHPELSVRENAFEWYLKCVRVAGMLGAETVGGHMGAYSEKDFSDPRRRELLLAELLTRLRLMSIAGRDAGLKSILWEPMPVSREPPATILEARTLLADVNVDASIPIELCVDVGHACNLNANDSKDRDPYSWLTEMGKSSPCVHLQQTDGEGDRHWPFTDGYNKVGIIDGAKVVRALDESGAVNAYLYLEAIPASEQDDGRAVDDIVQSVKYWREYV